MAQEKHASDEEAEAQRAAKRHDEKNNNGALDYTIDSEVRSRGPAFSFLRRTEQSGPTATTHPINTLHDK